MYENENIILAYIQVLGEPAILYENYRLVDEFQISWNDNNSICKYMVELPESLLYVDEEAVNELSLLKHNESKQISGYNYKIISKEEYEWKMIK